MAQIKILEAKQQSLFSIAQTIYELRANTDTSDGRRRFLTRTKTLERVREEYTQVVQDINVAKLAINPEYVPSFKAIESFDELYSYIRMTEQELVSSDNIKPEFNIYKPKHKLPVLELVPFNGDHTKWPLFYQNFKEMIHDNEHLTDAERVQYLVSKLSGSALSVTAGVLPVASNYKIIWDLLVERYQDQRVIATHYLNKIINFKNIPTASPQHLDSFIENYCASVAALKLVKIGDLSDFIITHIALNKLDKETVNLFEQNSRSTKMPSFSSLEQFVKEQIKINSRSQIYTRTQTHTQYNNNARINNYANKQNITQKSKLPIHSLVITDNTTSDARSFANTCVVCKDQEKHPLYRCTQFIKLDAPARNKLLSQIPYCKNCLGFHNINKCNSLKRCIICDKKHHSMIHVNKHEVSNKAVFPHSLPQTRAAMGVREPPHRSPLDHEIPSRSLPALPATTQACASAATRVALSESETKPLKQSPPTSVHAFNERTDCLLFNNNSSENILENKCFYLNVTPTARVYVLNSNNKTESIRVLLDTGSNANFITESCCKRLNLKVTEKPSRVHGIGGVSRPVLGSTMVTFGSRFDFRYRYSVETSVVDCITGNIPTARLNENMLEYFNNLPLADDTYYSPAEIDCVIGSGLFPHLLLSHKVTDPRTSVVAVQSTLGYIMMGEAEVSDFIPHSYSYHARLPHIKNNNSLNTLVQKFWELEAVPSRKFLSPDEESCESIYVSTTTRDKTGRFYVDLPFKLNPENLGNSYETAKKRYFSLERKFNKSLDLRKRYNEVMRDYLAKGFISLVPPHQDSTQSGFYLPHWPVIRDDKVTTKLRVVLDASAKTDNNLSLNDMLHTGCNLQADIFNLLINIRMFSIAFVADVKQMYLCIGVHASHRKYKKKYYIGLIQLNHFRRINIIA